MELSIKELCQLLNLLSNSDLLDTSWNSILNKLQRQLKFQGVLEAEINQEIATLLAALTEKKKELEEIVNG